jgi:solute carrier family 25 (adenine nucleotide translocator) protein 4/5/6/31
MSCEGGETKQVITDLVIGSVVASFHKTVIAPIERIKLLLNTRDANPDVVSGKLERFKGVRHCITCTRAEQGITSFWRGNLVNCVRYAPQQGSALAFNDALNNAFPQYEPKTHFWQSFAIKLVSGGLAGAASTTLFYPLEVTRRICARDYNRERKFNGLVECVVTIAKAQGPTSLFTGWSGTVAGAFVYRAGQLGCFKQIQDMNPYKNDKGPMGVASAFIAVTTARTVALPFFYPFDTVRRRMMLQWEKPPADRVYSNCFSKVLKREGLASIYRGICPEMFRGVGGSLVVVGYDRIKVSFDL